jgi:vacuolar-type H+-ATPase subunit C/Vma6
MFYTALSFPAPYFVDCINEQDLDELNVEIIRNTLYKAYIEDFYKFCKELGGKTAEVMCEILAVCFASLFVCLIPSSSCG